MESKKRRLNWPEREELSVLVLILPVGCGTYFPFAVFNISSPLLGIYCAEKVTSAPFQLEDGEAGRYLHVKREVGRISVSRHKSYLCFHVSWCDVRRTRVPDNHTPPSAWSLLVSGSTTVICA